MYSSTRKYRRNHIVIENPDGSKFLANRIPSMQENEQRYTILEQLSLLRTFLNDSNEKLTSLENDRRTRRITNVTFNVEREKEWEIQEKLRNDLVSKYFELQSLDFEE